MLELSVPLHAATVTYIMWQCHMVKSQPSLHQKIPTPHAWYHFPPEQCITPVPLLCAQSAASLQLGDDSMAFLFLRTKPMQWLSL